MPVTLALAALLWITSVATGAVPGPLPAGVASAIGVGTGQIGHGRVWTLLASGAVDASWPRLLIDTVLLLAVGAVIEGRLRAAQFLGAVVLTQLGAVLVALGLAAVVAVLARGTTWGTTVATESVVTPSGWILGMAMAGSAALDTLWRRRIRAVLLTVALSLVLFTGLLQDMIILGGVLTGFVVGPLLVGRRPALTPLVGGTVREARTIVSLVVAAAVLGPLLVAFSPHATGPLWALSQFATEPEVTAADVAAICDGARTTVDCRSALQSVRLDGVGSGLMTLMPALAVLVAVSAMRRGVWLAHRFVVAVVLLLAVASVASAVQNFDILVGEASGGEGSGPFAANALLWTVSPVVAFLALVLLLVVAAPYFHVRLRGGAVLRGTHLSLGVVAAGLVVYVVAGALLGDGFDVRPSLAALVVDYPTRLLPPLYLSLIDPSLLAVSTPARVLQSWIGVPVWLVCLAVAWWTLRSAPVGRDDDSTDRMRALLRSPGGSTLSWMSTWDDNHYWFSPDGDAAVAYRVRAGVALSTGDPVAAPDRRGSAAAEWAEYCSGQGWTPCPYSVTEPVRDHLVERGWGSVQVAEETVIALPELEFKGKKFQDVRTALNRARKDGIEAVWSTAGELPLSRYEQIVAISEEWVADKGMPEMGFTLGGIDELHDPDVRVLLAVDAEGTVHGVTSWMPVYRDGELVGLTLDFMRRRADGFRPVMEFLIASAALSAKDDGLEVLSLSGAPLAHGSSRDSAGADRTALDRVLDRLGRSLEPVYGFRSLLSFKAKFQPEYRPMYLCFPDSAALVPVGIAVGRAYLPDVELGQGARLLRKLAAR